MRSLLRPIAWAFIALGWLAVGADAYWSWRDHGWSVRPIAFYLDLIDPDWARAARDAAFDWSAGAGRALARALTWPVWGPALAIGFLLALLAGPAPSGRAGDGTR